MKERLIKILCVVLLAVAMLAGPGGVFVRQVAAGATPAPISVDGKCVSGGHCGD